MGELNFSIYFSSFWHQDRVIAFIRIQIILDALISHLPLQVATILAAEANWEFAGIKGIGWHWTGVIWVYNIVIYLLLDPIKLGIQYALSGKAWNLVLDKRVCGSQLQIHSCCNNDIFMKLLKSPLIKTRCFTKVNKTWYRCHLCEWSILIWAKLLVYLYQDDKLSIIRKSRDLPRSWLILSGLKYCSISIFNAVNINYQFKPLILVFDH